MRKIIVFLTFLIVASIYSSVSASSPTTRIWEGQVDGVPVWITVIASEQNSAIANPQNSNWWEWGNTTTDSYLFAIDRPENTRMILSFAEDSNGFPEAKVFLNSLGRKNVSYTIKDQKLLVNSNNGLPYMVFKPMSGNWVENGVTNFNLQVSIDGAIPGKEGKQYPQVSTDGVVDWEVTVHSTEPGVPDWQLAKVANDPAPQKTYERYSLTKRMETAPAYKVREPFMPTFPFVGLIGKLNDYFQENRPPFYLDLAKSELVFFGFTNRQSGVYWINSSTLPPTVEFESPFAFYNFAEDSRYPQLAIRSWYYPSNSEQAYGTNSTIPGLSTFRYSWKMADEKKWVYSLQVAGPYAYTDEVQIGPERFLGVDEAQLPGWVVSKPWQVITFVEATDGYAGGEGIYFYSPQVLEVLDWFYNFSTNLPTFYEKPYVQETNDLRNYYSLPLNFRGEYQTKKMIEAKVYFSPVDQSVHLLGAQGGVWYLGAGKLLRYANFNEDNYIDGWIREEFPTAEVQEKSYELPKTSLQESLFQLGKNVLYSSENEVHFIQTDMPNSLLETAPPKDKISWNEFRNKIEAFPPKKDPTNLLSWLNGFPGEQQKIENARASAVRFTSEGWRFVIELKPGFHVTGSGIPGLQNLMPGSYLVEYNGSYIVRALDPLSISIDLNASKDLRVYQPTSLQLKLFNSSLQDVRGATLKIEARNGKENSTLFDKEIDLLAGNETKMPINWQPMDEGKLNLATWIEDENGQIIASSMTNVDVRGEEQSQAFTIAFLTSSGYFIPILVLLFASAAFSTLLFRAVWGKERKPNQ